MAKKLTRKQIVKQDVVKSTIVKFWENIQDHPIPVTAVIILLTGGIILGFAWFNYSQHKFEAANALFASAIHEIELISEEKPEATEPTNKKSEKEQYQTASDFLHGVVRDYPDSRYAAEALYYLGSMQMKNGDYEEAIKNLKESTQTAKDDVTRGLARYSLAKACLKAGKYKEAEDVLLSIQRTVPNPVPEDFILWEMTVLYDKQGEKDKSKEMLDKIKNDFPASPFISKIDNKLALLEKEIVKE